MKNMKNLVAVIVIAVIVTGCVEKPKPSRSEVMSAHKELATLESDLQNAKANNVDFFSPDGYKNAKEALDEGVENAMDDKIYTEVVATGSIALQKAKSDTQKSQEIMREVLAVREKAKKADAPDILPQEFSKAEDELQDNLRLIEKGKSEKAQEERGALISSYSDLELTALKRDTVSIAKSMIAKAENADAKKYAPRTFALSKDELALAMSVLEAERTQTTKATEHATRSATLAKRSIYIADTVKVFKQRNFTNEEIVLWYQEQLDTIHAPLPSALDFTQNNYNVVTNFEREIKSLMNREESIQNELQKSKESYNAIQKEQTQLAKAYEEKQASYIKINKEAQARYEKVQAMFTPEEAIVYRQGNNVLLTTYGFNFAIGKSEIKSENFDLSHKIIEAIKTFDKPYVIVKGHTDATGSDKVNQNLSQKRAETVATFLKKVEKIPNEQVSFEGYGESKPLASNETSNGRAKNRRIEILILNKK